LDSSREYCLSGEEARRLPSSIVTASFLLSAST
jgi:hypothetical protein